MNETKLNSIISFVYDLSHIKLYTFGITSSGNRKFYNVIIVSDAAKPCRISTMSHELF